MVTETCSGSYLGPTKATAMQIIIYSISVENDCLKHIVPLKVIWFLITKKKKQKTKNPEEQSMEFLLNNRLLYFPRTDSCEYSSRCYEIVHA